MELKLTSMNLILEPKSIKLDSEGRIDFSASEIIDAFAISLSPDAPGDGVNIAFCNSNVGKCGKGAAVAEVAE